MGRSETVSHAEERRRVDAAVDRWEEAREARPKLWSELSERDKERLALRRLRRIAAAVGWDGVLQRLGVGRREDE